MTDDALVLFDRAATLADGVVAAVRTDQLDNPTPCTEWSVRQLLNHVVTGNLLFASFATGGERPDRGADHLGDDHVAAFRSSVAVLAAAFDEPGFLERTTPNPFGEGPGRILVTMRFNELCVHSWDLARATGQSTDLDPELIGQSLEFFQASPMMSAARQPGGPFGVEQPAPHGATAADRLAAFVGRRA